MATEAQLKQLAEEKKRKLRFAINDMLSKGKDENFVRKVGYKFGYAPEDVESELSAYKQAFNVGSPTDVNQANLSSTQNTALNYGKRTLEAGKVLKGLESGVAQKGFLESLEQKAQEMAVGGTITNRFVPEEYQQFDQAKRDFVNAVLRRESGAAIAPSEFESATQQYFPVPGDAPSVVEQKRKNRELVTANLLKEAGVNTANIPELGGSPMQEAQVSQPQQTQTSPFLNKIRVATEEEKRQRALQEKGFGQKVMKGASKVGDFLGVKKFGQGIATTLFLQTQEGKDLQARAQQGDVNAQQDLQSILDEAPTNREVVGSAGSTLLNVGTAGLAGGGSLAGKVAQGAGVGYGFDVTSKLQDKNKSIGESFAPGAGTVVGGALPAVFAGASKLANLNKANISSEAKKAVGQIVQGKTKDIRPAIKTISEIKTDKITKYSDLKSAIKDNTKSLGLVMDDILSKDVTPRKLEELTTIAKVGGKEVKTNYAKQALDNLEELYSKTNDPIDAQKIRNIIEKANTAGLTVKELNDVAKKYGTEFGKKAFSKTGEALTGTNAVAYENTRTGLKKAIRNLLPDDNAKMIDQKLSEHINTSELVDKMIEKVNNLNQKINERGFVEQLSNKVGKVADLATGHGLRGLVGGLFPSNVGLKTMNSLDLERMLQKNLSKIEKLNNNPALLKKVLKRIGTSKEKVTLQLLLNSVTNSD